MPTFLFDKIVFGPVKSRRFGRSLGINLLPLTEKQCNFNCIYCECGLTKKYSELSESVASKQTIIDAINNKFKEINENKELIDVVTFAGNGEPTLHPDFLSIIQGTIIARDKYIPSTKIFVLTNSTTLKNAAILQALTLVDKAIFKLDAGTQTTLAKINRFTSSLDIEAIVNNIANFPGHKAVQTMFLKCKIDTEVIDNTTQNETNNWFKHLLKIQPQEVMIYSTDRDTPLSQVTQISKNQLKEIAAQGQAQGLNINVY